MEYYSQKELLESFVNNDKSKNKKKLARLISITSGKGGVGKTNFILNLAIAMSIRGKKVLLIDADINLSNIDVLLGLYPEYNVTHLLDEMITVDQLLLNGPKGVKILPASSGDIEMMTNTRKFRKALIQAYQELRKDFDYILIDTGAGIADSTVDFVINSDKIVVVTTPEPTAITDAYAMIKILYYRIPNPDISLMINMVQTETEGKNIYNKINLIVQHFLNKTVDFQGHVLMDKSLPEAVKEQVPIIIKRPRSTSSACIHNIAMSILKEDQHRID
jgi:flagellar biosynthesis protein FlhG